MKSKQITFKKVKNEFFSKSLIFSVVLAIFLTSIIIMVDLKIHEYEEIRIESVENELKLILDSSLQSKINHVDLLLTSVVGYFQGSENVTNDEFITFNEILDMEEHILAIFVLENNYVVNSYPDTSMIGLNEEGIITSNSLANNEQPLVMVERNFDNKEVILLIPINYFVDLSFVRGQNYKVIMYDEANQPVFSQENIDGKMYDDVVFDKANNVIEFKIISTKLEQVNMQAAKLGQLSENPFKIKYIFWTESLNQNNIPGDLFLILGISLSIGIVLIFYKTNRLNHRFHVKLQERNDLKKALDVSTIVAMTDANGTITYVNDEFCKISKYSRMELIGHNHRVIKSDHHPPQFFEVLWKTISQGKVWRGDIKNKAKDGSYYWVQTTIVPFIGKDGKPEQYIAIHTNITNQKRIERRLKESLEEIKKTDQLKDEFSTMVSHELKTPITPIKFNTEMLLQPNTLGTLNSVQIECVQEIQTSTERLERLISDLLYAQKLEMKKMAYDKKTFNVKNCVEEAIKNLIPLFEEKEIKIEVKCTYDDNITSDEDRLQQVLENLIKNAVDFVPDKEGKISIKIQNDKDFLTFCVTDNGIGIPASKKQHLFKKFYQADTTHARKHGGTGLGLVICKGFVEDLGGKIWCESKEGQGTSFFFTLPKNSKIEVVAK